MQIMLIIQISNLTTKQISLRNHFTKFSFTKSNISIFESPSNTKINSLHVISKTNANSIQISKNLLGILQIRKSSIIRGLLILDPSIRINIPNTGTRFFQLSQRKRITGKLGSLIGQTTTGGRVSHRGSSSRTTGKRLNRGGTTGKELRSINTSLFKITDNSLRRVFLIPLLLVVLALIFDQLLLLLIRFQSKLLLNLHHLLVKLHLILFALKTGTAKKGTGETLRGTSHRSRTGRLTSICQPFNKSTHIFKELEESGRCSSASMHILTRRTCIRFLDLTNLFS